MTECPIILMTLRGRPADEARRDPTPFEFEWMSNDFSQAVVRAGGTPVFVSNECNPDHVAAIVDRCNGLFLTGGEDVEPRWFGKTDTVGNLELLPKRDAVEFAAVAAADRRNMPILGVCRGAQVLNIARGGSIYQDLEQEYPTRPRDHSRGEPGLTVQTHEVELTEGCRLQTLLGVTRVSGATSHHQAIRDLGKGLTAVGHSPEDRVIEAIEEDGDRFIVGVQWHPEVHNDDPATINLFKAFISACVKFAGSRVPAA